MKATATPSDGPVRVTCHCGAVEIEARLSAGLSTARRCDCSYCRRRGTVVVSAPVEGLRVVRGADRLTRYQWGTMTAEHYFCAVCGTHTHHRRRSNPSEYGVNLGAIEGVNPRDLDPIPWADGVNHPSDKTPG